MSYPQDWFKQATRWRRKWFFWWVLERPVPINPKDSYGPNEVIPYRWVEVKGMPPK